MARLSVFGFFSNFLSFYTLGFSMPRSVHFAYYSAPVPVVIFSFPCTYISCYSFYLLSTELIPIVPISCLLLSNVPTLSERWYPNKLVFGFLGLVCTTERFYLSSQVRSEYLSIRQPSRPSLYFMFLSLSKVCLVLTLGRHASHQEKCK
jgi:hypothetical protein